MAEEKWKAGSEEQGRAEAQKQALWWEVYGAKLPEVCRKLDEILKSETQDKLERLEQFLEKENLIKNYASTEEIAAVTVAVLLCGKERESGNGVTFLNDVKCVAELEEKLQRLRFYIFRLEFLEDEEIEGELIQLIKNGTVSLNVMTNYTMSAAIQPMRVLLRISKIFFKAQMQKEAVYYMMYVQAKWSGNYWCKKSLSEIYCAIGDYERGIRYKRELQNWTLIGEVEEAERELLQEKLWLLRYGDGKAAEELGNAVQNGKMNERIWEQFVMAEEPWQTEQYLTAANSLFEEELDSYAEFLLKWGNEVTGGDVRKSLDEMRGI